MAREPIDKEKKAKERQALTKQIRVDMDLVFGTPEGRRVLRHLKDAAGFGSSMVGGNPSIGMDVTQGILYNLGRQSLYLELRQLISSKTLKQVEYENLEAEIV